MLSYNPDGNGRSTGLDRFVFVAEAVDELSCTLQLVGHAVEVKRWRKGILTAFQCWLENMDDERKEKTALWKMAGDHPLSRKELQALIDEWTR